MEARREQAIGASGTAVETTPKRTRRMFSAADKLRIVKQADACFTSGERGRVLAAEAGAQAETGHEETASAVAPIVVPPRPALALVVSELPIASIRLDGGTRSRASLSGYESRPTRTRLREL